MNTEQVHMNQMGKSRKFASASPPDPLTYPPSVATNESGGVKPGERERGSGLYKDRDIDA